MVVRKTITRIERTVSSSGTHTYVLPLDWVYSLRACYRVRTRVDVAKDAPKLCDELDKPMCLAMADTLPTLEERRTRGGIREVDGGMLN